MEIDERLHAVIKANIARGVALLDEAQPGWRDRVRLDILDMSFATSCVLGQVYMGEWNALEAAYEAEILAHEESDDLSVSYPVRAHATSPFWHGIQQLNGSIDFALETDFAKRHGWMSGAVCAEGLAWQPFLTLDELWRAELAG